MGVVSDRRVRLWLFLLFQALYGLTSSGNAFRVPDEFEVYYQVESLVDAGSLSIPQAVRTDRFFGRIGIDAKPYAPYGPLMAFLAVPHHIAARGIARLADVPRDSVTWTFVVSGLTMLTTSTGAALAVPGFHRAATAIGAAGPAALGLSLLLGGATVLWPYGTSLYSEGWQAAGLVWAAVCVLERRVVTASILLALVGLIKATSLVFVPGFFAAVLFDRSLSNTVKVRTLAALTVSVMAAVAIHCAWNAFRFGSIFEFGYDWAETVPALPARAFLFTDLPRGLAVLLASPGKSVLLWAPVLALSIARWRKAPAPLAIGVLTSAVCGLVFYGAYLFPEGGYAHGPRHLVPIIPLLLLPAAVPGRPWPRWALASCAVVGMSLAILAVSIPFLQDQALGGDFQRLGYYERIEPAPGRAWNRYRFEYIPFVRTLTSGEWPANPRVGAGADFFALHLLRARALPVPASRVLSWLPWVLLTGWTALLVVAGLRTWRIARTTIVRGAEEPTTVQAAPRPYSLPPPLAGAILVAASLAYLSLFVPRGWIPHDEGMIGQSAHRVLSGELPHVDYEEPYTGGLALLHGLLFKVAGINLLYPRWLLFAGAALAQVFTYLILRRYLGPLAAAFCAWLALTWSFPNYFAALPSWWVLICAIACLWSFIRFVETGRLGYVASAGIAAGISILAKQTGLYVLIALTMALIYSGAQDDHPAPLSGRYGAARLLVSLGALSIALMILRARFAPAELLYLLLPIAACSRLLLGPPAHASTRATRPTLVPVVVALGAAAVPLLVFIAPYAIGEHLLRLATGLYVLPQKRLQFASFEMPPAYWIALGLPMVAAVLPFRWRVASVRFRTPARALLWTVAIAVPLASLYYAAPYQAIWQSSRAFAALLPVAACSLLLAKHVQDPKQRAVVFGCATMLAWASLVQFPFSAPIYFCYVTPLAVIAAVVVAGNTDALRRPILTASAAALLLFSVLSMNRGYVYNLGFEHDTYALNSPLDMPKASVEVSAHDAEVYRRTVSLISAHVGSGQLVAGPDCPEVYFLTGQFSPSGSLFDFFVDDIDARRGLNDLPGWSTAQVVVLNHRRTFTPRLSSHLVKSVRAQFPQWTIAGPFEVRWR